MFVTRLFPVYMSGKNLSLGRINLVNDPKPKPEGTQNDYAEWEEFNNN